MDIDIIMKKTNPLQFVQSSSSPMIPLILLLNSASTKYPFYYYLSVVLKLISLLILSSNFTIEQDTRTLTKYLRYFTSYNLCKVFQSGLFYIVLNIVLIVIEVIYCSYLIKFYIKFKQRGKKFIHNKPKSPLLFSIIFHVNNLLTPQLIEFFMLIIYTFIFKDSFKIFTLPYSKIIHYILCAFNIIIIIFLNFNTVITYQALNFPFYSKKKSLKINLTFKRFVIWTIIDNLSIIESVELFITNNSHLKAYKVIVAGVLLGIFIFELIVDLTHLNFEEMLNHVSLLIMCFSFISLVFEVILYLTDYNIKAMETFLFSILSKLILALSLLYFLKKLKLRLFFRHIPHIIFKIYDDKIHNNEDLYDNLYYLFFDLIKIKENCHSDNRLINSMLNHVEQCKNDICKCKLIDLIPINMLDLDKKEFCESIITRIGFCVETCLIKLDYTSNFFLTVLLAEYFYLFKNNSLMSLSIIDTFLHSQHIHHTTVTQSVHLCLLMKRYAHKCHQSITYGSMCSLYHALLHDKIISKQMKEYTEIFEKGIINKENFENGIKCTHDLDTNEIIGINSKFLSSKNIDNIMTLLKEQNSLYKKSIKSISLYLSTLTNEIPIDFYLKVIFFFYLYNNGHLPMKVLEGEKPNDINSVNMFRQISRKITFFNESTVINDIEDLLNEFYSGTNISYNIIIKCVKGFKIDYISAELPIRLGYTTNQNASLIGEDFEILFPKDFGAIHHKAMVKHIIANNNCEFYGKKYLFNSNHQLIPCMIHSAAMPGLYNKHLEILINVAIPSKKNNIVFMINSEYETISISQSLEEKYSINMNMIKKFDFDLLEMYELGKDFIKKNFENECKKLIQIKKYISMSTEIAFSKWLFHNRISELEMINLKKYEIFDSLTKGKKNAQENIEQIKEEIENLYSIKKNSVNTTHLIGNMMKPTVIKETSVGSAIGNFRGKKIIVKKNKLNILRNFFKYITKLSELEQYDEYVKQLAESLFKFKKNMKILTDNEKRNSLYSNNIIRSDYQYKIKIKMRILFGNPFYIICIRDQDDNFNNMNNSVKTNSSFHQSSFNKTHSHKSLKKSPVKTMPTGNQKPLAFQSKVHKKSKLNGEPHSVFDLFHTQGQPAEADDSCLITGLFTALIVSISITSILFYLQNQILKESHSIFITLFHNTHQKDNLLNIYNSMLSIAFILKDITNINDLTVSLEDYFSSFKDNIDKYEENYHLFYMSSKKAKTHYSYLEQNFNFHKIQLNWEHTSFEDDYLNQVYSIVFNADQAVLEIQYQSKILNDVDMIMYDRYLSYSEKEVGTYFGKLLFYLKINYLSTINNILELFNTEIENTFNDYYNTSSIKYVSVEVAGLITYILFFVQVFLFLHKKNKLVFKYILTMFLSNNNHINLDKMPFKNHGDNIFLRQKCKSFLCLLKSFQIDNLKKFQSLKNTHQTTTNMYTDSIYTSTITNTHQNSIAQGDSFNNSSINNTNNTLLKTHYNSTNTSGAGDKNILASFALTTAGTIHKRTSSKKVVSGIQETSSSKKTVRKTHNSTTNALNTNSNQENSLSMNSIIELTHNSGVQIIKILAGIMLASFLMILLFFCLKTYFSLSFLRDIKLIFHEFLVFTDKYSLLYLYYNTLRELLISPYSEENINHFNNLTEQVSNNLVEYQNININKFKNTNKLNEYCNTKNIDEYNLTGNFFENGINVASDAVILNIRNIFSDYLENKNSITSTSTLITFLQHNNNQRTLSLIDTSFNFIYKEVQNLIYTAFGSDAETIRSSFKTKVNIFNIICLIYCCIIFMIVIYYVVINIKQKVSFVRVAANKFGKTVKHWLHNGNGIYSSDEETISPGIYNTLNSVDMSMSSKK